MKNHRGFFFAFLAFAFLSGYALAQDPTDPPPVCCGDTESISGEDGLLQQTVRTSVQSDTQVYIFDEALVAMGLTQSQFVDRLAAGFFPNRSVDLLIPKTDLVDPRLVEVGEVTRRTGGRYSYYAERLIAVQVKRYYQFPRFQVSADDIETMNQIFITDGEFYVEVNFRSAGLSR